MVEKAEPAIKEATAQDATLERPMPAAGTTVTARPSPKLNTSPTHGLWALTNRDLKKWYTNPYQLIISLVQPVIWMGLFGKALNFTSFITSAAPPGVNTSAILKSFFGTTSYFSYLVCGMLIFIVLFSSTFAGMSVVWDRRFGFMNKALTTPVSRGTVVMAKILQSVGRSIIQAVAVLLIGIALGMETSNLTVLGIAGTFVVIFMVAMGLSGLFVMLSLRSTNWQTQMAIINLLNLPLLFASNALFPVKIMPTWLQDVVKVNPVSYAIDAIRQLLIGATGTYALWVDFSVVIGFAAFFSIVGIVMSWRLLSK
ncbi:MAG TPA: ABC transporter permease [Nitrososphaerales archaeon]|nr:ABC transporter permease [Nitrososphaerales archaeon]